MILVNNELKDNIQLSAVQDESFQPHCIKSYPKNYKTVESILFYEKYCFSAFQ